jgi:transposase
MAKVNKPRRTWKYSENFKATAVAMSYVDGVKNNDVAEKLDIHPYMLSRWRKEYREGKIVVDKRQKITNIKKATKELSKLKKLEKENAQLKKELDLLKKWQRFLAEEHQNDIDSSKDSETS